MAKYVLLRVTNDERMLLVDCENMTVDEVDSAELDGEVPETAFRGVDMAIVASQRSQASSFPYVEKQ